MGYRSDIRCLIYGPPDAIKKLEVAVAMLTGDANPFEMMKGDLKYYNGKRFEGDSEDVLRFIDLTADDWKWYDSYPEVIAWHKLMDWIQENEPNGVCLEYIRVGEEEGDVDQKYVGSTWGFYYPRTMIRGEGPVEITKDGQG